MPRSAWGMLRTLLLLALVACSSKSKLDDKPAAPKDASTAPKSVDIAPRVPVLPEPVIELPKLESFTLVAPGKGPLAPLRYQLAAGTATDHAESRLKPRQLVNRVWSKPVELPPIRDGFAFAIDADPKKPLVGRPLAGEIAGTATPAAEQYLASWRALENRRFSVAFDARGQLGPIVFNDDPAGARSAAAKDELAQRLLATVVPVPEEPVGVGAKWKVVTALRQRPAIVKQTATYTLLARTAAGWKIGVDIQRVAEEQDVRDGSLPPGASATLIALLRRYEGTLDVDPKRPLPTGSLSVASTLHVRVMLPGHGLTEQILDDTGSVKLTAD